MEMVYEFIIKMIKDMLLTIIYTITDLNIIASVLWTVWVASIVLSIKKCDKIRRKQRQKISKVLVCYVATGTYLVMALSVPFIIAF